MISIPMRVQTDPVSVPMAVGTFLIMIVCIATMCKLFGPKK